MDSMMYSSSKSSQQTHDSGAMEGTILAHVRQCATMNHIGIKQLHTNQFRLAINSFGSALRLLNKLLAAPPFVERATSRDEVEHINDNENEVYGKDMEIDDEDEREVMLDDDDKNHQQRYVSSGEDTKYTEDDCGNIDQPPPDNHIYTSDHPSRHDGQFYKTPIRIPSHLLVLDKCPTYDALLRMSISIMFNFALSHHLAAATVGVGVAAGQLVDTSTLLDQSVALYELTHTLQLQVGIELSIEHTMATICNLGHIHQIRGATDKATKCFQHLLAIIVFLQCQNRHLPDELSVGRNDDIAAEQVTTRSLLNTDNIFFQSVSHLMVRDSDMAAAA
jgi:hypothetical protein